MNSRVGEKHKTKQGYEVEIIEYINSLNCIVVFKDNYNTTLKTTYKSVKEKWLSNPNHPSVYNVGYLGQGVYKKDAIFYEYWHSMIRRCYSKKALIKDETYKDVIVCEEWKCFQVFAEWVKQNHNPETMQGWHLDKDILIKGNKVYSPDTCCLIPQEINKLFTNRQNKRGDYPIGVHKYKKRFVSQISKGDNKKRSHIGVFDTPEEAFQAYKVAKEKHIKEVADKWKDLIDPRVYEAMINWKVEITD